ncbi:hypothetical protein DKE52_014035 [Acinetobacter pittii]|uniref:Uncharacterized protein n=1 Tax=Acinetobacter pittii TaxID=48296 RepID=A0A3G6YL75_ACIPI|nr:hypothetical protein DKE52_014035 [Acinetobacter pittii]
MDNEYAKFFLNRKVDIYQLECIELSHPSFLNTYRVVRNDDRGVYVKHNEGGGQVFLRISAYVNSKIWNVG